MTTLNPFATYKLWHSRLMQVRKGARIHGCDEEYIIEELDKLYAVLGPAERKALTVFKEEEAASKWPSTSRLKRG